MGRFGLNKLIFNIGFAKKSIAIVLAAAMMLPVTLPIRAEAAEAASSDTNEGYVDRIIFGNESSEQEHQFIGEQSVAVTGGLGQTARKAEPLTPREIKGGSLIFQMEVDPVAQNYLTVKFWGDDLSAYKSVVYINGEQAGYRRYSDYEAIHLGNDNYRAGGNTPTVAKQLPGRFYYNTIMLPLDSTYGTTKAEIEIRTYSTNFADLVTEQSRGYYSAYTHTQAYLDISNEQQGTKIQDASSIVQADPYTDAEKAAMLAGYTASQQALFNTMTANMDTSASAKLSIVKYSDELRFYASCLSYDWCPANTPELKKAALGRLFKTIDNHVKDYYGDTKLVQRGGHQGDWGGYYGALGEALYIVENLIADDSIYGSELFEQFLDQPFVTGTVDGTYSLKDVDWNGSELSRREAWERTLKANFDFARSRLSYIYNQVYYTYEGAWKAHEGLRVIGSDFYEGKQRSHNILLEMFGVKPFLGEEVLVGPNGEELDLYHSLFYHDRTAVFTEDYEQIVAKGLAKSKLDENGEVVRRLPFGEHYTTMTEAGLSRENNYVGAYGESVNYLPEWFYKTLGHAGDEAVNDELLKQALESIHARSYTRYSDLDDNGKRIMRMQQVVDERNPSYPGIYSYATKVADGIGLHFASLEMHMAHNEERYSGTEWDVYWSYANEAVAFIQQQLADHQFFNYFSSLNAKLKYDLLAEKTYQYVTGGRTDFDRFDKLGAGVVHPQTDFDYYTEEELAALGVNPDDYEQFAWVDVDAFFLSLRDGATRIFGALAYRNQGIEGNGRLHVLNDDHHNIVQVATDSKFKMSHYRTRMNNIETEIINDQNPDSIDRPQALSGEIIPIAYQPGVGDVVRDNFAEDHAYAGTPDLMTARYGPYLMIFNSTRDVYGNEETFEVELPSDFDGSSILDLVSKANVPVVDGKVSIAPKSAMVLKLTATTEQEPKPFGVKYAAALAGNGYAVVYWKTTAGAESYTIKRSATENGVYEVIATGVRGNSYKDTSVENGNEYFYKVAGVNASGSGWDSYRAKLDLSEPASNAASATPWRDDRIGPGTQGHSAIGETSISISSVNGSGLGDGNDTRMDQRDIHDSLHFVHQTVTGSSTIIAKLDSHNGEASGLMLRDSLDSNARYVYLGADEAGNLVLRNRTKDTRHTFLGDQFSPLNANIVGYQAADYPYLKLIRDYDSHNAIAYASRDGSEWSLVGQMYTPFPYAAFAGVVSSDSAQFSGVTVSDTPRGLVYPQIGRVNSLISLSWNKPRQAVSFGVYRTFDRIAAAADPVFKAGTQELEDGSPWVAVVEDQLVFSVVDSEPSPDQSPGYKVVPIGIDGTFGEFSEAVYPEPESVPPLYDAITVTNNPAAFEDTVEVTGLAAGNIVNVYASPTEASPLGSAAAADQSALVRIAELGSSSGTVYVSVTQQGLKESVRVGKSFVGENRIAQLGVDKDATLRFNTAGAGTATAMVAKFSASDKRYGIVSFSNVPKLDDPAIESVMLRTYRNNTRAGSLHARFIEWDDWSETNNSMGALMKSELFGDDDAALNEFLASSSSSANVTETPIPEHGITGEWNIDVTDISRANTGDKATYFLSVTTGEVNPLTKEYASGQSTAGQYGAQLIIKYRVNKTILSGLIDHALLLDASDYSAGSWGALQAKLEAAQAVDDSTTAAQTEVNVAATELKEAMNGLEAVNMADLSGPEQALAGQAIEILVGARQLSLEGMTAVTAEFKYDQEKFDFATFVNDNGTPDDPDDDYLSLSEHAYELPGNGLQVIGSALKPDTGKLIIIMAAMGDPADEGELFRLKGTIKPAAIGIANIRLTELTVANADATADLKTENAIVAIAVSADKNALNTLILSAKQLQQNAVAGSQPGQYPQAAKDVLNAAILAAEAVELDSGADQATVNAAIQALKAAMQVFQSTVVPNPVDPVSKAALTSAIEEAQARYNHAAVGEKVGQYPEAAQTAFGSAIQAAKAVRDNISATQAQVDQAEATLNQAMQTFSGSIVSLIEGATSITIRDLSIIAKYYGIEQGDTEEWRFIEKADVTGQNKIDIVTLAAVARMILSDWMYE